MCTHCTVHGNFCIPHPHKNAACVAWSRTRDLQLSSETLIKCYWQTTKNTCQAGTIEQDVVPVQWFHFLHFTAKSQSAPAYVTVTSQVSKYFPVFWPIWRKERLLVLVSISPVILKRNEVLCWSAINYTWVDTVQIFTDMGSQCCEFGAVLPPVFCLCLYWHTEPPLMVWVAVSLLQKHKNNIT